jgi:hypothetical protein
MFGNLPTALARGLDPLLGVPLLVLGETISQTQARRVVAVELAAGIADMDRSVGDARLSTVAGRRVSLAHVVVAEASAHGYNRAEP